MTNKSELPERQMVCRWCLGPKFGDNRCICNSPDYDLMEPCAECGEWTDVDHLHPRVDGYDEYGVCGGCIYEWDRKHDVPK